MEFVTALRANTFDEAKPSLFELLSEAQLSSLLPPTLRYLLTVATQRYPRYLLRTLNSFDELYALLALVVERHYLLTRGGSFTEHFYGLRRERCVGTSSQGKGSDIPRATAAAPDAAREALRLRGSADLWRNLAVVVGVPYLKRKLDEAYEIEAPRRLLGTAYNRPPERGAPIRRRAAYWFRWFLSRCYPSVHAAYHFAVLAFHLAYLFDRSRYHHPLLWLIGTRIRRMNAADYRAVEMLSKGPGGDQRPGSAFSPRNVASRVLGGLSVLLPASIFALKFLEWWYASDFAKQLSRRAAEGLELPPPVVAGLTEVEAAKARRLGEGRKLEAGEEKKAEEKKHQGAESEADSAISKAPVAVPSLLPIYTVPPPAGPELCAICDGEIVTATACQTGFVYCYICIHKWVAGEHPKQKAFMRDKVGKWESGIGRCAVTGRRVLGGTEGLRRIMV
ncbi:hypothetical protein VTK73DRAFT_6981 [Phialemonium thermophilum]|uniref:Peroxisome assembly protein 12 n=1 Tax=Phialemonium thermophilum TaxID=223376 RepID=A0ABR3WH99_9PEZI